MEQPSLVVARPLPEALMQGLSRFGAVHVFDPAAAGGIPAGARVWVGTAVDAVPAELIARFPDSLGLIANIGVGIDNIDLAAADARGIQVSNTPVVTEDTADLTMALMLATCRRTGLCERLLREGNWAAGASQLGQRVHGKTLGIIGFGAIGQAVAQRARGFDMPVIYHGPRPKPEAEQATGAQYRHSLAALLGEADIVSLNCPLSASTRHLINADTLAQMKPGAILINTGRGPLVDEAALVDALASGHLSAAGLDVFEFEPEVTPALLTMDKVTLLPHIGSATGECRMDMALRAFGNIQAFLEKGRVLDDCLAG
jgi:glyoxylate reductase